MRPHMESVYEARARAARQGPIALARMPWHFGLIRDVPRLFVLLAIGCSGPEEAPSPATPPHGDSPSADDGAAGGDGSLSQAGAAGVGGATGAPRDADAGTADCPAMAYDLAPADVLATRLARLLWDAEPDAALRARLATAGASAAVMDIARDMLADPRAERGLQSFFSSWLRLGDLSDPARVMKDDATVLTAELVASMQREAPAFGSHVVLHGDARFETLLTAPYTFVDETLARHYGMTGVSGAEMRQVDYGTSARIGVLGGAGVLTRFSGPMNPASPPRRYWMVFETLLCASTDLPSPPAFGVTYDTSMPIREALESMTADPARCMVCHSAVNPIALAFLRLDSFGRYVERDAQGRAFDPSGELPALGLGLTDLALEAPLSIEDQPSLIRQLAARAGARRCFAARVLHYARDPAPLEAGFLSLAGLDRCSLAQAAHAFEVTGGDIRALLVAVTGTAAFLAPGEG